MNTVDSRHLLRMVTVVILSILLYSTIGITNGVQTNNPVKSFDDSRDTTYLSIVPSSQTVDYGETFHIVVHLDPGEPIIGVQIDLSFTASLIQVDSVISADSIWFFFSPIINNTNGEIHGAGVAVFGTNVTTPINCFDITFTAQNIDGISPLTLHDVIVINQSGSPINPVITNGQVIVGTPVNLPPVFGTPSPANNSGGNPLSFSWSIPIADPEGNTFSWTIQCSNGQENDGTGASNGTKSLGLFGLGYSTSYTVWVNATDPSPGSGLYTRKWFSFTTQQQQNLPPNKPNTPTGPASGKPGTVYTYSTSTIDSNNDQVYYQWDWGDGTNSNWLGPYNSGTTVNTTHSWGKGSYSIKVKAKDTQGAESPWSDPLSITMPKNAASTIYFSVLQILKQIFERFPNTFPFLRHLLGC